MTDYETRKVAQQCTYPGCLEEPADGNGQCIGHRDDHRARNRKCMRRARAYQRAQLVLVGVG